jgi:hypothetical protein
VRRLECVNATAAIVIETADARFGHQADAGYAESREIEPVDERFVNEDHRSDYERFLNEDHHRQYGSPSAWALGKCVFESAVSAGLLPEHNLLDFACGALRFGKWVIPYLEDGNYFGVDSHLPSLEAAATYEIPLHGLEGKRPRLLWNDDLALSHFGTTFDWIVDHHGSRRIKPKHLRPVSYAKFAEVLTTGGRLLTTPDPAAPIEAFAGWGLRLSRKWVSGEFPLLIGTSFFSNISWWEFVRE